MLKLISFLYHDMIAEKKKKKEKKRKMKKRKMQEKHRLKRWLQIFEKRTNRKWHERKNSLENKLT